ncbi:GDSL-type esterase/lipase family protein [Microbacterium phyllosphaerae]|uniref:GDSL-type esterase/lipase family protein n=1 Tax=Microbacterium phyllosphaerae TaxID=124798 RepID=UPI003D6583D8
MITIPITPELVGGVAELETTGRGVRLHRLPAWVRSCYADPQLLSAESQPSGARLSFSTRANRVELQTHSSRTVFRGVHRPRGRLDVVVDGELLLRDTLTGGDLTEIDLQTGTASSHTGEFHTTVIELPKPTPARGEIERLVEIWLPHNESLELIALRTDAPIRALSPRGTAADPFRTPTRWLHHGSSISQGSNAVGPSEIWPVVAARRAGVSLRNLGFGGSALVDPFMARVIRDTPADVISVKLGINVVNLDAMRVRAFVPAVQGFIDTIREGHPNTPLLLVSPIFCGIHEHASGPGAIDPEGLAVGQAKFLATGVPGDVAQGRLTLDVIRRELRALVERRADDSNLHYLDGTTLYSADDAETYPLPDNLHPDSATHELIGSRFAAHAFGPSGVLVR